MWTFTQNISVFLFNAGLSAKDLLIFASLICLAIITLLFLARYSFAFILIYFERHFRNGRFSIWLNLIDKVTAPIIILNGLYYGSLVLPISHQIFLFTTTIYLIVSIIFFINLIRTTIKDIIQVYLKSKGTSSEAIKTVINFANVTSTIVLWIIAILIALQLTNVDAGALMGGLGIASIIVAFSFQSILRDVFAFFSIYVDRAFAVGDYIYFDKHEGTIKEIRLRTTKLKGHEIIIPNNQLINGAIENFHNLKKRRVAINFRVQSNLGPDTAAAITQGIKDIFTIPEINGRLELSSVTMNNFTDYGIEYYIIYRFLYHTGESNFYQHLAYKEKVLFKILQLLKAHRVPLAQTPYAAK